MADATKLLPVTLPSWPTCHDCLSWSKDHLAVAGGDYVYILTPKNPAQRLKFAGHPQWHVLTLRINLFQQDEWPDQIPATIRHASIGEEQSNSRVVALSWSPPGLGMHRHCILGVLTSNLVLSFWETNGSPEGFERTCIFNQSLTSRAGYKETGKNRRQTRVRAFAWLPPVKTQNQQRWGVHHLVIADDDATLILFRVSKKLKASLGGWIFERVLQREQPDEKHTDARSPAISPLQRRLYEHAPITKLSVSSWEEAPGSPGDLSRQRMVASIAIRRGVLPETKLVSIELDHLDDSLSFAFGEHPESWGIVATSRGSISAAAEHRDACVLESIAHPQTFFKEVLQPIRDDFDATNQLAGHHRVRYWGATASQDGSKMVTCVTLHPSDMIEYTIPSAEKCILVFQKTDHDRDQTPSATRSGASTQEEIVKYALTQFGKTSTLQHSLDKKMLLTYIGFGALVLDSESELRFSLKSLAVRLIDQSANLRQEQSLDNSAVVGQGQRIDQIFATPEECEICGAAIPFNDDTSSAVCRSGHRFSRCQISFLAIQEPGISKYCTQCGKQFLDLTKLGPTQSPCFAQTIFDEFDVCPYCQANYRG